MIRVGRVNSKRQRALDQIKAEVAEAGEETQISVRLYIENRISFAAYKEAVREGLAWHARKKTCTPEACTRVNEIAHGAWCHVCRARRPFDLRG